LSCPEMLGSNSAQWFKDLHQWILQCDPMMEVAVKWHC
jgi:hypothetical protein